MCGLSGIVVTKPELIPLELAKGIFSMLMIENDDRGGHSWGAWGTNIPAIRGLGKYRNGSDDWHEAIRDMKYNTGGLTFLFGHTRYGTHGAKTVENSHPFEEGSLILAHNGVVDVEGYDHKDHAVDSGRIAKAVVQHGWKDGMAKVTGMCGLLVSVGNIPMIYRHEQVLHYATFDWGTVISSTLMDLELVVKTYFGMTPTHIGPVIENTFTQPGWGNVNEVAPGAARKPYVAPVTQASSCGTRMIGDYASWDERWDDVYPADHSRRTITPYTQPTTKAVIETATPYVRPLPMTMDSGPDIDRIYAGKTTEIKRTPHTNRFGQMGPTKTELNPSVDEFEYCECCGNATVLPDLYVVDTGWSNNFIMCIECIVDEITTGDPVTCYGRYGEVEETDLDGVLDEDDIPNDRRR